MAGILRCKKRCWFSRCFNFTRLGQSGTGNEFWQPLVDLGASFNHILLIDTQSVYPKITLSRMDGFESSPQILRYRDGATIYNDSLCIICCQVVVRISTAPGIGESTVWRRRFKRRSGEREVHWRAKNCEGFEHSEWGVVIWQCIVFERRQVV